MTIETEEDLEALRRIGAIVADCLRKMAAAIEPGVTTQELDQIGAAYLAKHGARSAPILAYNFPGTTCISINNEVAHGIPGSRVIKAGDMVNIDVSAELDSYFADTGGSFVVPPSNALKDKLIKATKAARDNAIAQVSDGRAINVIGAAIESCARSNGFTIIRNLGSHGVGRKLHEAPEFIAPYANKRDTRKLKEGMVITIEPFLSTGAKEADDSEDGWTLVTPSKFLTAQFEHTLVVTKGKPIILTA